MKKNSLKMFIKPIPLKFVREINKKYILIIVITVKKFWKTFDNKKIPFLANENFKYVKLVRKLIFKKLFYFEQFFFEKRFTYIILLKLKQEVILKLINNPTAFKLIKYKTFIIYILFKEKYVKRLFVYRFIKFYIKVYIIPVLFTLKLYLIK